jgi:hypothetical protein
MELIKELQAMPHVFRFIRLEDKLRPLHCVQREKGKGACLLYSWGGLRRYRVYRIRENGRGQNRCS